MIIDKSLELSAAQAVTASVASTNYIDLGAAGNVVGNEPWLVIQTREAAVASGSATVNFQIQTATDSAFTSPVVLFDSGAVGKAALTLNSCPVKVKIPLGLKRYVRVYFSVATGPLTAGKFDAFIAKDV